MSTEIVWNIDAMQCRVKEGDLTDIVIICHWRCSGTQTDGEKTYSASVYSTCSLPAPEGTFVPYDQLTLDQVLGWIWAAGVNKDATEAAVEQQIQLQINPPVVTLPNPWQS
jgi:hypothetical protein